jgi:hypothetical protein
MPICNFPNAVDVIFKNWTALQLAVSQGAGGPQSRAIAAWLVNATAQWFSENRDLEPYEVESFLEDIINTEFNMVIEDCSIKEVSKLLCDLYALCSSNASETDVEARLQTLPKCDLSACRLDTAAEDENELECEQNNSEASMEVDSSEASSPVDPDGWTTVSRKKK